MGPKTQPADGEDAAENSSAAAEVIARDFDESIHLESPHSIGVDIVEIERMRAILERTPRFKTRIFSEDEQAYCNKKARPECHYATRFAAKEAVLKALGTGFSEGIGPRDVEVVITAKGKPQVKLYRRAEEKAAELGIKDIPLLYAGRCGGLCACTHERARGEGREGRSAAGPSPPVQRGPFDAR